MSFQSEKATKPSTGAETQIDVEILESEDSLSHHSFDFEQRSHKAAYQYVSTTLVTSRNISLADVMTEVVTKEMVVERIQVAASRVKFRYNPFG